MMRWSRGWHFYDQLLECDQHCVFFPYYFSIIYDWSAFRRRTVQWAFARWNAIFFSRLPLKGRKSQEVDQRVSFTFRCRSKGSIKGPTFGASMSTQKKRRSRNEKFLFSEFDSARYDFFGGSFRCSMQSAILLAQLFDLCRDLRRYSNESQFNGEMEMAWMNAQNVSSFSIGFVFAGASNKRNATKPQWLKGEKYTREFLKCKKKFAC